MFPILDIWRRFYRCQQGTALTTEVFVVAAFVVFGLLVALSAVRDSFVAELADATSAVNNAHQSYLVNGVGGASSTTSGSDFADDLDPFEGPGAVGTVSGFDFGILPQNETDLDAIIQPEDYQFTMTRFGRSWTGTGDFDNGRYTGSPFWPGDYTIDDTTITVDFDPLGGGWTSGTLVLDASNPYDMIGEITWINTIAGFIWEAAYRLVRQ